jgi:mannosidase alpha-like ER degradation enhancer 1
VGHRPDQPSADPQYLYLLFDNAAPTSQSNAVFTTEGHSLYLPHHLQLHPSPIRRELHRGEQQFCPVYRPPTLNGLRVGIEQREDWEYGRSLIYGNDLTDTQEERKYWSPSGYCAVPLAPKFVSSCRDGES